MGTFRYVPIIFRYLLGTYVAHVLLITDYYNNRFMAVWILSRTSRVIWYQKGKPILISWSKRSEW